MPLRLSAELLDYAAWRLGAHKKEDGGGGRSPVELTRERREALTVALRRMPASGWCALNDYDRRGTLLQPQIVSVSDSRVRCVQTECACFCGALALVGTCCADLTGVLCESTSRRRSAPPPITSRSPETSACALVLRVAENADKQGISPRLFPTVLSSFRQLLLARTGASQAPGLRTQMR